MAALAVPLLESAALALARALGFAAAGVAGGAAINEAAKRKVETAEKVKAAPIAQAETQTKANTQTCKKCPPDCGTLVERNWSMSEEARAYQARITGFAPYTEWSFMNIDFDGFVSNACVLKEAKARYDQFFEASGDPEFFFRTVGVLKIMSQAQNQSGVIWSSPPSQLHWHFMQPLSHRYFAARFGRSLLPIQCFLTP